MTPIEEPLDRLVSFCRYFALSFYTGMAKSIIDMTCPPASEGWYLGYGPLRTDISRSVHDEFKGAVIWDVAIKAWSSMQIEQKRIRFVQMCSNGGRDPFPHTGFLEPWLELSKSLNRTPFQVLDAVMEKSLKMINLMNREISRVTPDDMQTRDSLRGVLLPLFAEEFTEPPPVPSVGSVSASVLQETFIKDHPHWKGKVAFPVDVPIGALELTSICQAVCPQGHAAATSFPSGTANGSDDTSFQATMGMYLDATTGLEVINPQPGQAVRKYGELQL
jgi:hypothetical protein